MQFKIGTIEFCYNFFETMPGYWMLYVENKKTHQFPGEFFLVE